MISGAAKIRTPPTMNIKSQLIVINAPVKLGATTPANPESNCMVFVSLPLFSIDRSSTREDYGKLRIALNQRMLSVRWSVE
jgi:hypothetical protein